MSWAVFHQLQADIDFKVVKIGLLCSIEQIRVIADLVRDKIIVLDPIIKASSEEILFTINMLTES
jgi:hydroxymethylpyrimidine/phosphomethylpyrimidine kinase